MTSSYVNVTFSAVFALVRKWCTNASCERYVIVMITGAITFTTCASEGQVL
jgi:hypothetical protein